MSLPSNVACGSSQIYFGGRKPKDEQPLAYIPWLDVVIPRRTLMLAELGLLAAPVVPIYHLYGSATPWVGQFLPFVDACGFSNLTEAGVALKGGALPESLLLSFAYASLDEKTQRALRKEAFARFAPDMPPPVKMILPFKIGSGDYVSIAHWIKAKPNVNAEHEKKVLLYLPGAEADYRSDRQLLRYLQAQGFNILAIELAIRDQDGHPITDFTCDPLKENCPLPNEQEANNPAKKQLFQVYLGNQLIAWSKKLATDGLKESFFENVQFSNPFTPIVKPFSYSQQYFIGRSSGAQRGIEAATAMTEKGIANIPGVISIAMPSNYQQVFSNLETNEVHPKARNVARFLNYWFNGIDEGIQQIKGRFDVRPTLPKLLNLNPNIRQLSIQGTRDALVGRDDVHGQNTARALYTEALKHFPKRVYYAAVQEANHNDILRDATVDSQRRCNRTIAEDYDLSNQNIRVAGIANLIADFVDQKELSPYTTISAKGQIKGYSSQYAAPYFV